VDRTPEWRPGARTARARRADALELAAAASVIAVVALFLADGGAAALDGAAGIMIAGGQLTGLVGADLVLVQLLLSARLPWVDRVYGHDRALVAHGRLGRVALPVLVVHALALTVGYAVRDRVSWVVEPFHMLVALPDMLTAALGFALLTAVAVTSVAAARRRLGYERWFAVHLLAYGGVLAALPHQLSLGSDLAAHPVAYAYWLALYAGTAAALVVFRFLLPAVRTLRHRPRVAAVVPEGPSVVSVYVTGRGLARLPARAGQFAHWRFLAPGLWTAANPYSLSAEPDGRSLRLTVRALGDHSALLRAVRPGTPVVIEGPYGVFTADRRARRDVLLIAAGIGVTPIRALAERLAHTASGEVTVLYRANTGADLVLARELADLAARYGIGLRYLVGPPRRGSWLPDGIDDATSLAHLVPGVRDRSVFVCGPPAWTDLVLASLRRCGVRREQVHYERFAW
jgi:predicted ferric reductase